MFPKSSENRVKIICLRMLLTLNKSEAKHVATGKDSSADSGSIPDISIFQFRVLTGMHLLSRLLTEARCIIF